MGENQVFPDWLDIDTGMLAEEISEEDVYPPQRIFPTPDFWLKYRKNRLSQKNQFLRWKHLA